MHFGERMLPECYHVPDGGLYIVPNMKFSPSLAAAAAAAAARISYMIVYTVNPSSPHQRTEVALQNFQERTR